MKSSVILGGLALFASSSVALPTAAVGSFNNFYTVVARMTDLMHKKRGSNKKTKECIGTLPSLPRKFRDLLPTSASTKANG